MIDGKAANAICSISSQQVCNICSASPKQMNSIAYGSIPTPTSNIDNIELGLSPLHARIRCFECLLKKKGKFVVMTTKKFVEKKRIIQNKFIEELELRVDFPRQGGSGTLNNGNTARRAFKDFDLFSSITGIDKEFIERLANILNIMNSSYEIDTIKFSEYCTKIAKLYCEKYNWFYMPVSMHKLLLHSSEIISKFLLPIG